MEAEKLRPFYKALKLLHLFMNTGKIHCSITFFSYRIHSHGWKTDLGPGLPSISMGHYVFIAVALWAKEINLFESEKLYMPAVQSEQTLLF